MHFQYFCEKKLHFFYLTKTVENSINEKRICIYLPYVGRGHIIFKKALRNGFKTNFHCDNNFFTFIKLSNDFQ